MEGTIVQQEMKATIDDDPDFVPRVIEEVRAANITDRLVVISFNHDLLRQAKQLMPELKVGVLVYGALETMALPTSTWEMLGLQQTDLIAHPAQGPAAVFVIHIFHRQRRQLWKIILF